MANRIQYRRDTAANWTAANPVLASGELGYETDTKRRKIGDGSTAWNSLGYELDKSSVYAALAGNPDLLIVGAVTRDGNGAATGASVVWPDGTGGTYTGTPSTTTPGAIDTYTITYGSPVTKTYTQPTVTRDTNGAVTNRPAIVVS